MRDKAQTKVICTIGPSSNSLKMLIALIQAGMTAARFDLTYGDWNVHEIKEKRKRSAEKQVGDSPPMVTPANRTTKLGTLNPKRLQLSCGCQAMKKTPKKKSPMQSSLKKKKKIPAGTGEMGKLRYVTDTLRELGSLNVDELKLVCRAEDVPYEGKKMETILAITEKRTQTAYGSNKDVNEPLGILQEPTEVAEKQDESDESYLLLPVETCRSEDLPSLEQLYLQRWNPVLNTTGVKGKGKGRKNRQKGKHERSKLMGVTPCRTDSAAVLPVKAKIANNDDWMVDIFQLLKSQEEQGCRKFSLCTQRGNSWCRGWKLIRSAFGNSVVKLDGRRTKLFACKKIMEEGARLNIEQLRRWVPKAGPDKKFLRTLFRNPKRMDALKNCSLDVLTRLMKAAADFQKTSTTAYLRRIIARAIKDTYGWSTNARIVVRLKFDDRIRLVEVRKVVNDRIEGMEIPDCMKDVARGDVRIVWVKNPSVANMLHNQRAYAGADVLTCTCAGLPYPRVGDHVQFRLQDLEGVHSLICNANNVPKRTELDRAKQLAVEISVGIRSWPNFRGNDLTITRSDTARCMMSRSHDGEKYLNPVEVYRVKKLLEEFVLTPLDRNPGATLVLCPKLYFEAMMNLFVLLPGYSIITETEATIHTRMRADAKSLDLQQFIRWDSKGKIGEAYVMPKHKDLSRYRPICPTFFEPTNLGSLKRNVFGCRLMDDVSVVIFRGGKKRVNVELIKDNFERCYPENLKLLRTDDGGGLEPGVAVLNSGWGFWVSNPGLQDTLMTRMELFEKAEQIIVTNKEAKNLQYSRSGACAKYGVVAADLETQISWDDLEAAWHKRFQVEPPKMKATDKLMTFEQGMSSVDWIAEYQRLTSVRVIQMAFKAIKHYISRSCSTLDNALTHVEDTLMTRTELFEKAAQIIVTNKEAKNLHRSSTAISIGQKWPWSRRQRQTTKLTRRCLPLKGRDSPPAGMVAALAKAEDAARRRQTPHLALGPAQQPQPHGPTMFSPSKHTRHAGDSSIVCGATTISTRQWAGRRKARANRETEHCRE
ncbi:hypothetical protein CBR_g22965 [Chara braunii]|uniref:Pyruvate kinase barrel domain-containing protein n=1 Tax=Chara braunii TaxID=69332 RepID=A0A388L358_CHABU|nr:hypothetical protein CBR_g22965 [Chara braunii]|eukprot:GBG76749.1 hypothetical protein CBR_g22965 [Chara braunii]